MRLVYVKIIKLNLNFNFVIRNMAVVQTARRRPRAPTSKAAQSPRPARTLSSAAATTSYIRLTVPTRKAAASPRPSDVARTTLCRLRLETHV